MKYKRIILSIFAIFVVLLIIVFKGNLFKYNDINDLVEKPNSVNLQISGKWELEKYESFSKDNKVYLEKYKHIYVSEKFVKFGNNYTDFPKFKFRFINFNKYLSSNGIIEDKISNEKGKIIVTVDDGDFFYQEFIKVDDQHIAVVFDKKYLIYKLVDTKFDKNDINMDNIENFGKNNIKLEETDSTLLLGFKNKNNLTYETLLFRKEFNNKFVAKKTKGIFINKNNTFFLVDNILENGKQKGIYLTNDYLTVNDNNILETNGSLNYVGENYLSLEVINKNNGQRKYELYSNDNLNKDSKISITELAGESGKSSYYDSLRKIKEYSLTNYFEDVDNIGVYRKNSKWAFKSVFNDNSSDKLTSIEFDLDIIPLLPVYDTNSNKISTNLIKSKVDEYNDYFISPKNNLIAVKTENELIFYSIENQNLSAIPIATVKLDSDLELVMYQWKTSENSSITFSEFSKLKTEDINFR